MLRENAPEQENINHEVDKNRRLDSEIDDCRNENNDYLLDKSVSIVFNHILAVRRQESHLISYNGHKEAYQRSVELTNTMTTSSDCPVV